MNKKYLPSKQFVIRIITIAIIFAAIFGVVNIVKYFKNKTSPENQKTGLAVKDILTKAKDSNDNGIADWEESLWGFNPLTNGKENKVAILLKKSELAKNNPTNSQDTSSNNEQLSKEFFALIMTLNESGNLNDTSIKSVANAFGDQITPTPIADVYTTKDQIIKNTSTSSDVNTFLKSLNTLLAKHKDLGTELSLISQGVENSDPTAYKLVGSIADSYITFSKELIKIPVPNNISSIILRMANNYEKLGESTLGLSKGSEDPIIAMKSLINYNNYNNSLVEDTNSLSQTI